MSEFAERLQGKMKQSSVDLFTVLLKVFSGVFLGVTFGLILMEIMNQPQGELSISFFFVLAVTTVAFYKMSQEWKLLSVFIFDLICILIGIILRLYILVAPHA